MLGMKKMATVASKSQAADRNCGRNCLGICCMPGAELPLYRFEKRTSIKDSKRPEAQRGVENASNDPFASTALLDSVIQSKWQECAGRGLFRYDVTACETRTLDGDHGFVAQLNEGRHSKKRQTEFQVDRVLQPFDPKKFNFTKVGQEEVLFCFEESSNGLSQYDETAPNEGVISPNVVAINVSPIEYGHVLLVPRVLDCIPQRVDANTLLLALQMACEASNPFFRVGYNSLGAFATINHLHFQAYYLNLPFAIERTTTKNTILDRYREGLKISELAEYPVRALVYEVGASLDELAEAVAEACMALQDTNIPFNMLITDCGARIFLMPQCFAERQARGEVKQIALDTQVNPAAWEISGHIVLKRKEDFEMATENYAWKLLAEVSLSEARFQEVKRMCLKASEQKLKMKASNLKLASDLYEQLGVSDEVAVRAIAYHKSGNFTLTTRKSLDLEVRDFFKEVPLPMA